MLDIIYIQPLDNGHIWVRSDKNPIGIEYEGSGGVREALDEYLEKFDG